MFRIPMTPNFWDVEGLKNMSRRQDKSLAASLHCRWLSRNLDRSVVRNIAEEEGPTVCKFTSSTINNYRKQISDNETIQIEEKRLWEKGDPFKSGWQKWFDVLIDAEHNICTPHSWMVHSTPAFSFGCCRSGQCRHCNGDGNGDGDSSHLGEFCRRLLPVCRLIVSRLSLQSRSHREQMILTNLDNS